MDLLENIIPSEIWISTFNYLNYRDIVRLLSPHNISGVEPRDKHVQILINNIIQEQTKGMLEKIGFDKHI